MGLLDSNIVRQASKSLNISGATTTANTYIGSIFDVSNYQIVCFQVKSITSGVKLRLNGGITSGFSPLVLHNRNGQICSDITSTGEYYAEVPSIKHCGFIVITGVENSTTNIDVVLKSGSVTDLKPVQSLYNETKTLSAGATSVDFVLYSLAYLFGYFKFITVYANFRKTKTQITLSTAFMFEGNTPYMKEQEEVSNNSKIYSDWIPIISSSPVIKLDFAGAAAEGDTVYIEVIGIR